jgi:hypothetical protein
VTVWCSVSKLDIIGPYFFDEGETAVTVTWARYIDMLYNFLHPELLRRWVNMRQVWFQEDGATVHTVRASMEVVQRMFPQHVISRFSDVSCPPRSPDLSVCDLAASRIRIPTQKWLSEHVTIAYSFLHSSNEFPTLTDIDHAIRSRPSIPSNGNHGDYSVKRLIWRKLSKPVEAEFV